MGLFISLGERQQFGTSVAKSGAHSIRFRERKSNKPTLLVCIFPLEAILEQMCTKHFGQHGGNSVADLLNTLCSSSFKYKRIREGLNPSAFPDGKGSIFNGVDQFSRCRTSYGKTGFIEEQPL
jgi:hypothetical protein